MSIATGDSVTIEYTGRLDDGSVFDTSRESVAEETGLAAQQPDREYGPLTVEIGEGRVIEGLEDALVGQEQGGTPTVAIPPEKAYGPWSEDQVREYDREEFEEMVGDELPEEGAYLETQDGTLAEVVHVDESVVRVDFNHALAGETLEFDVEIVDVA
jgi:FKBP-type peptidyl-prolyl cis-trans isomerase 2